MFESIFQAAWAGGGIVAVIILIVGGVCSVIRTVKTRKSCNVRGHEPMFWFAHGKVWGPVQCSRCDAELDTNDYEPGPDRKDGTAGVPTLRKGAGK